LGAGTLRGTRQHSNVTSRVPQTLNVSRAKTNLTMLRGKALTPIQNTLTAVIRTTPSLAALKIHRGANNLSLFLSYHEWADALDYKKRDLYLDAPAFEYPVRQHVPLRPQCSRAGAALIFQIHHIVTLSCSSVCRRHRRL